MKTRIRTTRIGRPCTYSKSGIMTNLLRGIMENYVVFTKFFQIIIETSLSPPFLLFHQKSSLFRKNTQKRDLKLHKAKLCIFWYSGDERKIEIPYSLQVCSAPISCWIFHAWSFTKPISLWNFRNFSIFPIVSLLAAVVREWDSCGFTVLFMKFDVFLILAQADRRFTYDNLIEKEGRWVFYAWWKHHIQFSRISELSFIKGKRAPHFGLI